ILGPFKLFLSETEKPTTADVHRYIGTHAYTHRATVEWIHMYTPRCSGSYIPLRALPALATLSSHSLIAGSRELGLEPQMLPTIMPLSLSCNHLLPPPTSATVILLVVSIRLLC